MKNLHLIVLLFLVSLMANAQETYTNYKAVIKDASGNLMTSQAVDVRFTIFEGDAGPQVFTETHNTTTDAHGIVVLDMGSENTDWSDIDWEAALHYLKVEYNTGSGFVDLGTQPFRFVPYAQFAIKAYLAENVDFIDINGTPTTLAGYGITDAFNGNFNDLTNIPAGLSDGDDDTHLTEAQVDAYANNNGYLQLDPTDATTIPLVNNNSTGTSRGIDIAMNSDNNSKFGIEIDMQGTTPTMGVSAGINIKDEMDGTQNKYGIYQQFQGIGNSVYGVRNWFTDASNYTNYIYGVLNNIASNQDGDHFGTYNILSGSGFGPQKATYNWVSNTGYGTHYGSYNTLTGTGTGQQTATYNWVSNTGSGDHFGSYNILTGTGTGQQTATYNYVSNSGNNAHYGSYNTLTGTGSGNKIGVYSEVNTAAGGTHYAIWGQAEKTGSYAGFFVGDVYNSQNVQVMGELQGNVSGDADMKAYIYGFVAGGGTKFADASSDGFTVVRTATGTYRITFSDTSLLENQYLVTATVTDSSAPQIATTVTNTGNFDVHIWNISGAAVDSHFTFVVYKK